MSENHPIIRLEGMGKEFKGSQGTVRALENISLEITAGEVFGIIGLSGAGKSTLVRCINFLETPTEGEVYFEGRPLSAMAEKELRGVRQSMGMIFQQFNLLAQRNVLQNICFPMEIAGKPKKEAEARARELLQMVGLSDREKAYPSQLSGGQKQRVAIARAMVNHPKILLADEPTGALDSKSGEQIMELFDSLNEEGVTIVMITHDPRIAAKAKRIVRIIDGEIYEGEGDGAVS